VAFVINVDVLDLWNVTDAFDLCRYVYWQT